MNEDSEPRTAVDAARCLYLARVARREGNEEAAQRWQAKADVWMKRLEGEKGRRGGGSG